MQLLGSFAEVEAFRDGNEVTGVTQFHRQLFYTCAVFGQLVALAVRVARRQIRKIVFLVVDDWGQARGERLPRNFDY